MMSKSIKFLLSILFTFTLLGCALTARLREETPKATTAQIVSTPTAAQIVSTPTATQIASTSSATPSASTPTLTTIDVTSEATPHGTGLQDDVEPTSSTLAPTPTQEEQMPAPPALPEDVALMRQPVSEDDLYSATTLATHEVPVRDLRSLAIRLRGVRPDVPEVISDVSPDYPVGTVRTFKVHDDDNQEILLVEAELLYKTEHLYMWVERGVNINQDRLAAAAETFERDIYPTNRAFFGSEYSPGVDGDPHLSVLHARRIGSGVAGYYWSADEYTAEVRPDSNQMEMFYVNADNANVGSDFYMGTLAHEFQHMIHWHQDRNEETWLNEAMSELASLINGFDPGGSEYAWAQRPDTQLNTWSDDSARSAHYGGSFLFATYLMDRFGETMTQAVVDHPANGIASIDAVLAENDTGLTFTDVFADWVAASYLDDLELADGQFGYEQIDTAQPELDAEHTDYPIERATAVSQYGVDYIYLAGGRDLTLDFYGSTRARLVNTQAHSGDYFWYANRGDDSDMRLTQAFDLSGLDQATLRFWTWYDIESDWDYGYVLVSNDDGTTWKILRGPATTDSNPNGNNFGWGYTGYSGDGPVWIEEQIDLSAYAGQQVLIRFEYVTDDALNNPGWALDDIAIPELGYMDNTEQDAHGWQADGFVRINNYVPQGYLVQLITFGSETTVQRLPLRTDQTAHWPLAMAEADHAVLMVSGLAPVTTEPAQYFYRLTEMP